MTGVSHRIVRASDPFPSRLKGLRVEARLSQEAVADRAGVTRAALSTYENGKATPSVLIAANLAKFYGVSLDYLVGISDEPVAGFLAEVMALCDSRLSAASRGALQCRD